MRFISKFGRYGVQVQPEIAEPFATGQVRILQAGIAVYFKPWGLRPAERELALAIWGQSWNGFYQELDEVTMVPPDYRIGVFDSEEAQQEFGWSDEVREKVEKSLIDSGKVTGATMAIPRTVVPPPWPRYDEFVGTTDELLRKLVEEGHDLGAVLEYERANQKREDVLEGLQALAGDPDAVLELQPDAEEIVG